MEDPLTIRAFFSNNIPERIVPLQRQVFDILAEYEAHGGGKIKVERVDPLESKTAENEATEYGIRPIQLQVYEATQASSLQVYGSLALIYRDQKVETINIAQRYPQGYEGLSVLEYEISSKIWQLANDKPVVGLTGFLATTPAPMGMPGRGGQPRPEFEGLRRFLGEEFEVKDVDLKNEELDPSKVPLLLVVRPKEFTDVEVFRLDQYLMKGGRVLMFVTQGEVKPGYPPPGSRQRGLYRYQEFSTGLDKWLEHHGVRVPNEFVVHRANAYPTEIFAIRDIPGLGPRRCVRAATELVLPDVRPRRRDQQGQPGHADARHRRVAVAASRRRARRQPRGQGSDRSAPVPRERVVAMEGQKPHRSTLSEKGRHPAGCRAARVPGGGGDRGQIHVVLLQERGAAFARRRRVQGGRRENER